jgi:hypothetical protein
VPPKLGRPVLAAFSRSIVVITPLNYKREALQSGKGEVPTHTVAEIDSETYNQRFLCVNPMTIHHPQDAGSLASRWSEPAYLACVFLV